MKPTKAMIHPSRVKLAKMQLEPYVKAFEQRLMRTFDAIEEEANQAAEERYNAYLGGEDSDGSDAADAGQDAGQEVYGNLIFVRQQLIQSWTTGLFHLWERSFKYALKWGLPKLGKWSDQAINKADFETLENLLAGQGLKLKFFGSYETLNELRLVANTVKHGDGTSCDALFKVNKSLFAIDRPQPELDDWIDVAFADALNLLPEDFHRYAEGVGRFWSELDTWMTTESGTTT